MTKGTKILGVALVALLAAVWLLKTGNIGTQLLWNLSDQGRVLWPLITVAALIDSINPCAFAVLMKQASLPAAFMLGALVGVCEFPCTGGPYLMVLGLLHDQGTYLRGLG